VVGDYEDAPGGDVLDAVDLAPEILAMQHRHRREGVLRPARVESERVDARRAERHRDAGDAIGEALA
jgi:hypothetical protein